MRRIGPDHNGGPDLESDPSSMSGEGWVAVRREMRNHHLVGFGQPVPPADEARGFVYSRAEAWLDLIMECKYKDGSVMNGGKRMELKPGQLTGARSWLAHRWNWTPKTVRGFLSKLEEDGMIERTAPGITETSLSTDRVLNGTQKGQQRGTEAQIITICNYSQYQFLAETSGPAEGPAKGQQRASEGPAKGQNLTKEQRNNSLDSCPNDAGAPSDAYATPAPAKKPAKYPDDFETFWSGYPDKTNNSKSAALAAWQRLPPDQRAQAIQSLPNFSKYCRDNPDYRPLHAERYLRHKRYEAHLTSVASSATYANGESAWWAKPDVVAGIDLNRWRNAISRHANGVWPVDKLGPPPGDPRCVIPPELIDELSLRKRYNASGQLLPTGG